MDRGELSKWDLLALEEPSLCIRVFWEGGGCIPEFLVSQHRIALLIWIVVSTKSRFYSRQSVVFEFRRRFRLFGSTITEYKHTY